MREDSTWVEFGFIVLLIVLIIYSTTIPRVKRTKCPNVWAISVLRAFYSEECILLKEGQAFYQAEKGWELWQEEPLRFLKRWPNVDVYWVHEEKDDNYKPLLEDNNDRTQDRSMGNLR